LALALPGWRVSGPDVEQVRDIADRVKAVLQASPMMRTVNTDWGRVPVLHFTLDQNRLQATGLTSSAVAEQLQFLLSGVPITSVREDIRSVEVVGRAAGDIRLDPAKIEGLPWSAMRDSAFRCLKSARLSHGRSDAPPRRTPTITVRGDIADNLQPPDVSVAIMKQLQPIVDSPCRPPHRHGGFD
jgi:multidrug efflux pump subunit AcrB